MGVEASHHLVDGVGIESSARQTLSHLRTAASTNPEEPECYIPRGRAVPLRRGLTRLPGVMG
ncbi:Uncharacterised protein [Mycobacteroides abscessus subsp. abscessus]|nr:Uncharacterised protein [Mycobacteroides abscessus subsp. abscessus]